MKMNLVLNEQLNYLNMSEIKGFCKKHQIPTAIMIEGKDGKLIKSKDHDRKGVILNRMRKYLKSGKIPPPTLYSAKVCSSSTIVMKPTSRLHYGQYDKYNSKLISILQDLTQGKFKNGSIAREVMRDFWIDGKAPTLKEFARAWLIASQQDKKNHSEWAFLTDLSQGKSVVAWKQKRNAIAKRVLKELSQD